MTSLVSASRFLRSRDFQLATLRASKLSVWDPLRLLNARLHWVLFSFLEVVPDGGAITVTSNSAASSWHKDFRVLAGALAALHWQIGAELASIDS